MARERKVQKGLTLYPSIIKKAEKQAEENNCSFNEWIAVLIEKEEKNVKELWRNEKDWY